MALTGAVAPFGLRDLKLTPIGGGSQVDLPYAQKLTFTERLTSKDLKGDDAVVATSSFTEGLEWELEAGGISLDSYALMTGRAVTESTGTNLCTNGTFETDITGWTNNSTGTIARSTAAARSGTASLLALSGGGQTLVQATYSVVISPNTTYYAIFYLRNHNLPSGSSLLVGGYWSGGANADALSALTLVGALDSTGTWYRYLVALTPDYADRTGLRLYVRATGNTSDGQGFYLDDVIISSQSLSITMNATAGDVFPYFKIYGKVITDSGDLHVKIYKAKITELSGEFKGDEYFVTSCKGKAISDGTNIFSFVRNETAANLPSS